LVIMSTDTRKSYTDKGIQTECGICYTQQKDLKPKRQPRKRNIMEQWHILFKSSCDICYFRGSRGSLEIKLHNIDDCTLIKQVERIFLIAMQPHEYFMEAFEQMKVASSSSDYAVRRRQHS
jgi:hypothetical protein